MIDFSSGSKIIEAVRNEENLTKCLQSDNKVVFLLFGTLLTIPKYIQQLKEKKKTVFVHLDLIEGLASSKASVEYIKHMTNADGIISIKQNILKYAKSLDFMTILRIFLLDSKSLENVNKINADAAVDIVEMMPAVAMTIVPDAVAKFQKTIIGGGLVHSKEVVDKVLASGASAVSTSDYSLWK